MFKTILAPALGVLATAALVTGAVAQFGQPAQPQYQPPPQQQYQQHPQANAACVRLEAQLASLQGQERADPQRQQLQATYNQQRAELGRLNERARGMGCGRNFLFGPRPPAECRPLQAQIDRLDNQVDRLEDQLNRGRSDPGLREARRRDVIAALAYHRCGAQYEQAMPQQDRGGGLFGFLFGNRSGGIRDDYPGGPMQDVPSGTFRTVCVRTCDGFFYPISYATVPARFGQDENQCRNTCPGAEAMLFSYPTGASIEQGTATNGAPYTSLPNAFKYQTEYVKGCSCNPPGQTWEQALAGTGDTTVRQGDIIVSDERAGNMSQPQAGDSVGAVEAMPDQGIVENPANTELPPGYQPDPAAQTAEPYYMPPGQNQPYYMPPQQQQPAPPPPQPQRQQEREYVHPAFR